MKPQNSKRPSAYKADKALHEIIEGERERGEVNTGAEPDQKSELRKRSGTASISSRQAPTITGSRVPHLKKPRRKAASGFPDRQIVAKAKGRFAEADKQRATIKADPKKAVARARAHVRSVNR